MWTHCDHKENLNLLMASGNNIMNILGVHIHRFQVFPFSNYFPDQPGLCFSPCISPHVFSSFLVYFSCVWFLFDFPALFFQSPCVCPFPVLFARILKWERENTQLQLSQGASFQHFAWGCSNYVGWRRAEGVFGEKAEEVFGDYGGSSLSFLWSTL